MVVRAPADLARWLLLGLITVVLVAASSLLGPRRLGLDEIFGRSPDAAFWSLRVPRVGLAALAGAGLALGGAVFQSVLRNPLAEPYTLGIASGASLAAAVGFLLGWQGYWLGMPRMGLLALGGALLSLTAVYRLSRWRAGGDITRLLLAGVCIAYMCSAGVLLVYHLADRAITNDIVVWMLGSLGVHRPRARLEVGAVLFPVLAYVICAHRAIDLLSMGHELAAARGVAVTRTVRACFLLVGLLTAVIVANCGPIGFVGLMVPHIARAFFGPHSLPLTIGSTLLGAAFLAVCDGVARSVGRYELPVGIVTNILGAGFFIYLLATRESGYVHHRARTGS